VSTATHRHIIGFGQAADLGDVPPPCVVRGGLVMVAVEDGHPASRDRVAHHRRVLEHVRRGPFLPAAFGVRACADTAERLLAARQQHLLDLLARYIGCIEIDVRVVGADGPCDDPVSRPTSGRAFLQRVQARDRELVARREAAAQAARRLIDRIGIIADEFGACVRVRPAVLPDFGRFAIAARRSDAAALSERVAGLGQHDDLSGLTLQITGPWPLYSFTDVETLA
jgi:hypothetical protein